MRRERSKNHAAVTQPRPPRRIHEEPHDTYGTGGKLREPTACPTCGAVYHEGRWTWSAVPQHAHRTWCPACRRIVDDYPAGIVHLAGGFVARHLAEIEDLVRNLESREKAEHPLKRIFAIEATGDGVRIPTTDTHLARAIGRALFHAYRGELEEPEPGAEAPVRIRWHRE